MSTVCVSENYTISSGTEIMQLRIKIVSDYSVSNKSNPRVFKTPKWRVCSMLTLKAELSKSLGMALASNNMKVWCIKELKNLLGMIASGKCVWTISFPSASQSEGKRELVQALYNITIF